MPQKIKVRKVKTKKAVHTINVLPGQSAFAVVDSSNVGDFMENVFGLKQTKKKKHGRK